MKHDAPAPPELGTQDGISYALFRPEGEPAGGVVLLHGAGSSKESHFDFGRLCRDRGLQRRGAEHRKLEQVEE